MRSQTGRGFMVGVRGRHLEAARHNSRIATDYSNKVLIVMPVAGVERFDPWPAETP